MNVPVPRLAVGMLTVLLWRVACAQPTEPGGWILEAIGGPVSPVNPTVTVRVSAGFPATLWAFYTGGFDLVSSDPMGSILNQGLPPPLGPKLPGPFDCFIWREGTVIPGRVAGVGFAQIAVLGCNAHPAGPLPIWEAQWTAADFSPRLVQLETQNTPWYYVYLDHNGLATDLVASSRFRHASAVIEVVGGQCYADCDSSTGIGALDLFDFLCFQGRFVWQQYT
jgi:hypothetical protein